MSEEEARLNTEVVSTDPERPDAAAVAAAAEIIKKGGLVAFPTETVYGLGGDALSKDASRKIYAAKGRPSDNPLIVHIADMEHIYPIVKSVPEAAEKLAAQCWPGPLTMIFEKTDAVPDETSGGLPTVAVRMPSHKVAAALIAASGGYIAAPSANTSGRPSPTTAQHVAEDLSGKIDMILDGGPCEIGLESTIVDFTEDVPVVLRPGYIGLEELRGILGEVRMDPGLSADAEGTNLRPKAPGMRYRHYAPKGELAVVEGERQAVERKIKSLVENDHLQGYSTGVLASTESAAAYAADEVIGLGSRNDEEEIASHLYAALRRFDERGIERIYAESFYTPKIGSAIMNRLLKAAGHRVIEA